MPAEYQFAGRSRQPAHDSFNAMLNYGYGVLYSLVERAAILAGLDPFVGFLHTDNYNKRSLVFDMIEPFRIIAERTTVLLFTGRRVLKEFFREVPGGIELAPDGRAALLTKLNERLDRTVRYPVQTAGLPIRAENESPPIAPTEVTSHADSEPPAQRRTKRKTKRKFRKVKQRAVIQHEAHALANTLLGRRDLPQIVQTQQIWSEEPS
jgi:CRISPR-associated protein Cas1